MHQLLMTRLAAGYVPLRERGGSAVLAALPLSLPVSAQVLASLGTP